MVQPARHHQEGAPLRRPLSPSIAEGCQAFWHIRFLQTWKLTPPKGRAAEAFRRFRFLRQKATPQAVET